MTEMLVEEGIDRVLGDEEAKGKEREEMGE